MPHRLRALVKYLDAYDCVKVTFWISARNTGYNTAKDCKPELKLTDSSGRIEVVTKLSYPTIDTFFPVDWLVAVSASVAIALWVAAVAFRYDGENLQQGTST